MSTTPPAPSTDTSASNIDDCTICLSTLGPGSPLLTLSCNHKFHLQCLASNVQAKNKECPLCRTVIDPAVVQLLSGGAPTPTPPPAVQNEAPPAVPSVEDLIDEVAVRALSERFNAARQAASASLTDVTHLPMITAETTLEYGARASGEESNIYGLITLQAPPLAPVTVESTDVTHIPMDLVCIVDQSGSMSGEKITLLKQTLVYIVEQMSELDRLAIVSFETNAHDLSHGLKRMTQENKQTLKTAIANDIQSHGGTYIGSGLQMAIDLLTRRQTKNPLGALLLLTDGQDNQRHDYMPMMQALPEGVQCHTFGYGPDHTADLLVQLAQQGNGGTFTYIDEQHAVGSAFGMALGGLFTCVAQQIQVQIEFSGEYKVSHFHSNYQYEPTQLPSNKLAIQLHNLNADEKRNLLFQLHVPNMNVEQTVEMASQEPMSQELTPTVDDGHIGHVTVTYVDPNSTRSIITVPVFFKLIRAPHPSEDLLVVNHSLDRQRNRIETVLALERAMTERNFDRSRVILEAQVEKIQASVSAQDPFCQELIQDLQFDYSTESNYRSSHQNTYMSHRTERGTYVPSNTSSSERYHTRHQRELAIRLRNKNC